MKGGEPDEAAEDPASSVARHWHGHEAVGVVIVVRVPANYDSARIDAGSGASDICRKT